MADARQMFAELEPAQIFTMNVLCQTMTKAKNMK
jgi:hypothetical protein